MEAAGTPSWKDKVVLITGANAGLGYQLSLSLASMGAHVVMACRSPERAERAHEQLLHEVPGAKATLAPLDVSNPESIRERGALIGARVGHLDLLIHNAGIFGVPLSRNEAGHELHFATNYLGPFALTGVLLPFFRDAPGSRIVCVGSLSHRLGKLCIDELAWREADYKAFAAYARSKLALLAYTVELDRRLRRRSSNIIAVGAHPGFAPTDIAKNHAVANPKTSFGRWVIKRIKASMPTVEQAAAPILYAACAEGVRGGEYYGPGGWLEIAGTPAKARVNARALNADLALQLWSASEALTGVRYLSDGSTSR
jgi:NAD(P)-dependent dehydrogenase (short-subunit alcohol dehydrogenase family)